MIIYVLTGQSEGFDEFIGVWEDMFDAIELANSRKDWPYWNLKLRYITPKDSNAYSTWVAKVGESPLEWKEEK